MLNSVFADYLCELIKRKELKPSDVRKRALIDRRIFSKILNGTIRRRNGKNERIPYRPSKSVLFRIALALELNLGEAEELLGVAGEAFSKNKRDDMIVRFFFENQIYDRFIINECLANYGYEPLFGGK